MLTALKDLRNARLLRVRRQIGRKITYSIEDSAKLRHPTLRDVEIGGLLMAFAPVDE